MADDTPIAPFGVTINHLLALLPQATFPETVTPGQKAVTKPMLVGYINEVSRRVDLRLVDRARLTNATHLAAVNQAALDLVANGAASYAQAARFPEQAGATRDSYAAMLWDRFEKGLKDLAGQVDTWLADADTATPQTNDGTLYYFPPARTTEEFLS